MSESIVAIMWSMGWSLWALETDAITWFEWGLYIGGITTLLLHLLGRWANE